MNRVAVYLVLLAAGCVGRTETIWSTQLDHVRTLTNPHNRLSATMSVAESAAMAGDADVVADALDDLKAHPTHDDLAARCAGHLAAREMPREARRIARLIADPGKRQEALDKLSDKPKDAGVAGDKKTG